MSASLRTGRALGARSVVATSEGAKASEAVLEGGGRFGAKARSARATERSVRTVRVREGAGGERSRVREVADGRDGAERGDGAAGVAARRGGAERPRRES